MKKEPLRLNNQAGADRNPKVRRPQSQKHRRHRRHSTAVKTAIPGNGDGARVAEGSTSASPRQEGEGRPGLDVQPRDPTGASPLSEGNLPQHQIWEEIEHRSRARPFPELPICSPGLVGGRDSSVEFWLKYAANVIRDHADSIRRKMLPRLSVREAVEWLEIIDLANTIAITWPSASDTAQFRSQKYRVSTEGAGRFTVLEFDDVLYFVMVRCVNFEDDLGAVFLNQDTDERSALEWCEVLYVAEHYVDTAGIYENDAPRMEIYKERALLAKRRLLGLGEGNVMAA